MKCISNVAFPPPYYSLSIKSSNPVFVHLVRKCGKD